MSFSEKFQRLRQTGWKYSLAIVFNRIVPAWLFRCRRYVIYELAPPATDGSEAASAKDPDNATIFRRCHNEQEVRAVEQLTWFQRQNCGGDLTPYMAERNGQLSGALWSVTRAFGEPELGTQLQLDAGQAWLCAALIPKSCRRLGIYSRLLTFVSDDLDGQGITQQLVAVNPDNVGSNRIHLSRAKRTVGYVNACRFLKIGVCWTSGDVTCDRTITWNSAGRPILLSINSTSSN